MPRTDYQPIFLLLFLSFSTIQAQTKVSGHVLDEFNQPIPFVNILFGHSTLGTITDENGYFELESPVQEVELKVVLLGFENQTIRLKKKQQELKIILREGEQLQEVVVVKKPQKRLKKQENPAYRVLKEVWKRKANLGINQLTTYEYEHYSAAEVGLNNLDTLFLKKILGKALDSVLTILRQNRKNKLFYIPLNLREQNQKVYGDNRKRKYRTDINAQRISGVAPKGFFFKRIEKVFKHIDVFEETIIVADKSFSSPLAKSGFFNYDYILLDSLTTKKGKEYSIYFFPRRNGDWAFEGNMTIEAPSYALKQIQLGVNENINLNFIRDLSIEYRYQKVNDSIYLPAKYHFEGDFTLLSKSTKEKGLYIKKTDFFSHYLLDQPKEFDFYDHVKVYKNDKKLEKAATYWKDIASESHFKITRDLLTDFKNNRKIKSITNNVEFFTSGYKKVLPGIQLGRYWDTFNYNNIEGFRMSLGFRSFESLDDRFRTTGYVGYGFKAQKTKYGIDARYLISYQPRIMLGAVYSDDFEQLGSQLFSTSALLDLRTKVRRNLFARGNNYYLTEEQNWGLTLDWEVKRNIHFGVNLESKRVQSGAPNVFSIDFKHQGERIKSYTTSILSTYMTYTPNRNIFGKGVQRKIGRNKYVALTIKYSKGIKGLFQGDFNYHQLQLSYFHPIRLAFFGRLDANLEFGKTFGVLPNSLLNAIPANQGYSLEKNTFSLINYYDWITDTYSNIHLEHHFNGFFLNKIPFIKHLKFRSLATFRMAYGTISKENLAANLSNVNYNVPSRSPYFEYGFGIENIGFQNLRIFRLDFIWRSSLPSGFRTNSPKNGVPEFGIRLGVKPEL